jgi:uncharacterized membrane protein YciS (DUF1049 family)
MTWLDTLILKYGLPKLLFAAGLALVLSIVGVSFGWAKLSAWYYHRKADHLEQKLEVSKAETKVARKDEAQVTAAAAITKTTVAAQDAHAASTRTATTRATGVIYERVRLAPVAPAAAPADDPVVRAAVDQAIARAQAASDRLRGTPAD